uniref:Uncharacterized protein n=1 Tax=Arundo donax TaxID=35708 RepID=A0A0A8XQY5_ARUDO
MSSGANQLPVII